MRFPIVVGKKENSEEIMKFYEIEVYNIFCNQTEHVVRSKYDDIALSVMMKKKTTVHLPSRLTSLAV